MKEKMNKKLPKRFEQDNIELKQLIDKIIDEMVAEGKWVRHLTNNPRKGALEDKSRPDYANVEELAQAFIDGTISLQRDVEAELEALGEDPKQAFNLMQQWSTKD